MNPRFIKSVPKRIVAFLLVFAFALFLIPKTTAYAEDGEANNIVTLRIMRDCFNLAQTSEERTQEVEDAINAYIADKIGVRIELTDIDSSQYYDMVALAIANREVDLFWTGSWVPTIATRDLYAVNAAKDITDFLPGTSLYGSMDAKTWEAAKYDGRNYFIPIYKDNVWGYNIMFRKAFLDKNSIDISGVKGLADLTPILATAKAAGLKYPFLTQKTAMFYRWYIDSFDFFTGSSFSNWIAVDRDTDEVVDTILSDEYKEFCTLIAEWAEAGYISKGEASKETSDRVTSSQDWAVSWWTDVPNNGEAVRRYGQDVEMVKVTKNYFFTDSALGSCYAIAASASDEATKAAIDFMGLLYSDSHLADLYTYGIEGKDFNYDDNGYVVKIADATYNHSMWESANATVVTCESESPYTPEMYKNYNGNALISCANGFRFDKTPVEDSYMACQSVFEEYGYILENGGVAVADVEKKLADYQAALDAAGYQDVLAEAKKQYKVWKEKNNKGGNNSKIYIPEDANKDVPAGYEMLFRLYNPNSGEHFYTTSRREGNKLIDAGWNYEGEGWTAPIEGDPVYRLYNKNAGDHHYTTSKKERDKLISAGWTDEGIGWYSESKDTGKPLYRLYNPNATGAGSHHYTTSTRERDKLVQQGWNDEGIAWYGLNK